MFDLCHVCSNTSVSVYDLKFNAGADGKQEDGETVRRWL